MLRLLLALALLPCATPLAAEIMVRDDTGAIVTLAGPATRVVSLTPHATEMLFAVGATERIVGVDEASDFPAGANTLPKVGRIGAYDLERIVALQPDLVVAWASGMPTQLAERLRALHIPVFISEPRELDEIPSNFERLARLTGHAELGENAARGFRERLRSLHARYARRSAVSVFYQVWGRPLTTVGSKQIISRALEVCGARNVFANMIELAPVVSREAVLVANPDAIVVTSEEPDANAIWRDMPGLRAQRYGNFVVARADWLNRPTSRMLDGIEQVCLALDGVREKQRQAGRK